MDKHLFFEAIDLLIKESRKTYEQSPKRIVSDYNREVESTKEYNGRQILELLQNADDADSKIVKISFDKTEKRLVISNKGEAFTVGGIESLMMANLSTKIKKKFIGNKGLGFRSVLNWANHILIRTNGCVVEFSPSIAADEFTSLLISKEVKEKILTDRGLSKNTIPFPVLAIPKISYDSSPADEWTTIIEIYYKVEFENKIEEQLKECREEILLFLNNIDELILEGTGKEPVNYQRYRLKEQELTYIQINKKIWRIETVEDLLPDNLQDHNKVEKESYNITVAFQDDLSDEHNKLFNYFPTKLSVHLPCVIHATFELNSSRDYLNDSPINEYLFKQLEKLLEKISLQLSIETTGKADWRPLHLLSPIKTDIDSYLIGNFYNSLKALQHKLAIFPCIDGEYRKLNEIKYYGNKFCNWLLENNFSYDLPEVILPVSDADFDTVSNNCGRYNKSQFVDLIDKLSRKIVDLHTRVQLMSLLITEPFKHYKGERYSLLVNDSNVPIDKANVAFTPIIESTSTIYRPYFVKIDFINRDLYQLLCEEHRDGFQQGEPESREFQRSFRDIINIQPYDSNNVLSRIMSGTRERVKNVEDGQSVADIQLAVQCLFENYKLLRYKEETFTDSCPLLNANLEVKDAKDLFLGRSYKSGAFATDVYDGILTDRDYLCKAREYGIIDPDQSQVENFFVWLGVNRYVQFVDLTIYKEQWEKEAYFDFVFSRITKPWPVTRFSFKGKKIGLIDRTVSKLSNEKLVALIVKEERLLHALDLHNSDKFWYQYGNYYPDISVKPSYILFQLTCLKRFEGYLVESNDLPFINQQSFDFQNSIFLDHGISKSQINDVLNKLGAQSSFNELPINTVYDLIKKCADSNAPHKQARKLYSQCFGFFRTLKEIPEAFRQTKFRLLAVKEGKKKYINSDEVYYSDNSILPQKITDQIWMFDFPKRAGENQVADFFHVKTLKYLTIDINKDSVTPHDTNSRFVNWFTQIKPLILAYRISSLKSDSDKRDAANAIKGCSLRLASGVTYSIPGGSTEPLGFNEFLVSDEEFIICAEGTKTLEQLRESSAFCGAFAEIMCILFRVNEAKNSYISVFNQSIDFSKDLIKSDSLDEYLAEAYEYLGLTQSESVFWQGVCKIKKIDWPQITNDSELQKFLQDRLSIVLPHNYKQVDFNKFSNKSSYNFLKYLNDAYGISQPALKFAIVNFPGLINWHIKQIEDASIMIEKMYANTMWTHLLNNPEEQFHFITNRAKFRKWFGANAWQSEVDPLVIEIDYFLFLRTLTENHFKIKLADITAPIQICSEYSQLLTEEEMEKTLTNEQKSLLFFPGNTNKVSTFLSRDTSPMSSGVQENKQPEIIPLIETKIEFTPPGNSKKRISSGNGGGPVDPRKDRAKRVAGKKAERRVRDSLVERYGRDNVQWVSGNSDEDKCDDSLGYDFLYRESEVSEWFHLEVKSFSGKSFIISDNELSVAFSNKDRYHLGLVTSDSINIDRDFFKRQQLEDEYNQINSGIYIKPSDFEIFVEVPTQEKTQTEHRKLIDATNL